MKITQPNQGPTVGTGSGIPSGPAGGDLGGTFPGPTVVGLEGIPFTGTPDALDLIRLNAGGTAWEFIDQIFVLTTDGGQEGITAHGNTGTTETFFSAGTGNVHTATLNANCTFTFASVTSGVACSFTMLLTQDGTGSRLVTWPGSVVWQGGTAPTLATAAGSVDILTFFTLDGGTTWYGFHVGAGSGATGGTPALTLSTTNATGSASTVVLTDATIALFDATNPANVGTTATGSAGKAARRDHVHATGASTPTTQAFGDAAATGSGPAASMTDHKHGMPANPVSASAISALGFVGPILMTDGITSPPEPMWTEDGTDYIYSDL